MGGLKRDMAREAETEFEAIIAESFAVILPDADDFDLAKEYLGHYQSGLRAGDALHLAIARNHQMTMTYTLDKTLLKAGQALGLPISSG